MSIPLEGVHPSSHNRGIITHPQHLAGTIYHHSLWGRVIEEAYGHAPFCLAWIDSKTGDLNGVAPGVRRARPGQSLHPGGPVASRSGAGDRRDDGAPGLLDALRAPPLAEREAEYLANPKGFDACYMNMRFDIRGGMDALRAAWHPRDATVRRQVVHASWNPDFYRLIRKFEARSGRGAVLNASFNLHGHPIVCTPEDALQVFADSGLRPKGLGDFLVRE